MTEVLIYTKNWCGYCRAAKQLLERMDLSYREIDVTADTAGYAEMVQKANGRTTVPQIFIDGVGIGGYTDLYAMAQRGAGGAE